MGIFLGLLSYVAWSWVITIEITNLLDNYISLPEHSLWDIFAFLLPLTLSVVTLIWAIRKRESVPKYDQWYVLSVLICLALLEIIY